MRETREQQQQQQDEGWTENDQRQEPTLSRDATVCKVAKLKAKAERVTAINPTATVAVNGQLLLGLIADRRRLDALEAILAVRRIAHIGRSYTGDADDCAVPHSRYSIVVHGAGDFVWHSADHISVRAVLDVVGGTDSPSGASVPAVDPSRSTPDRTGSP